MPLPRRIRTKCKLTSRFNNRVGPDITKFAFVSCSILKDKNVHRATTSSSQVPVPELLQSILDYNPTVFDTRSQGKFIHLPLSSPFNPRLHLHTSISTDPIQACVCCPINTLPLSDCICILLVQFFCGNFVFLCHFSLISTPRLCVLCLSVLHPALALHHHHHQILSAVPIASALPPQQQPFQTNASQQAAFNYQTHNAAQLGYHPQQLQPHQPLSDQLIHSNPFLSSVSAGPPPTGNGGAGLWQQPLLEQQSSYADPMAMQQMDPSAVYQQSNHHQVGLGGGEMFGQGVSGQQPRNNAFFEEQQQNKNQSPAQATDEASRRGLRSAAEGNSVNNQGGEGGGGGGGQQVSVARCKHKTATDWGLLFRSNWKRARERRPRGSRGRRRPSWTTISLPR